MKSESKLKKLKMPAKEEIDVAELDMGMPEDEMGGEEMMAEGTEEEAAPSMDMLADISDDDLLAEVKKRGLMGQLGEGEGEEEEGEEEEYMA